MKALSLLAAAAISTLGTLQAQAAEPDTFETFFSEVSREDLREIQKDQAREFRKAEKRGAERVSKALWSKGASKEWTFVVTKKDDRTYQAFENRLAVNNDADRDAFRAEGFQIFPNVRVEASPVLLEKIKSVQPGRKIVITGKVTDVSLDQEAMAVRLKPAMIRMVLRMTLVATDCNPAS